MRVCRGLRGAEESVFGRRVEKVGCPPRSLALANFASAATVAVNANTSEALEAQSARTASGMANVQRHSWELPADDDERSWDQASADDASDAEEPERSPRAAAEKLLDELLVLYMSSSISAMTLCTLCHWASLAGLGEPVSRYAKKPGAPTGAYQRFLDGKLGFREDRSRQYILTVPGMPRGGQTRGEIQLAVKPPHELADKSNVEDPRASVRLLEAIDANELPPIYDDHPIVRAHPGELVMPWCLYMDGVAYSLSDTVLGIWIYNMVTGTRMLIALIRKRIVCACGCRGWCTYWPLLRFLRWSLEAMAAAEYPASRHDGSPWAATDSTRRDLSRQPMKMRGAIIRFKGDWAEFCERLGCPTWASGLRPCFCCAASGAQLYDTAEVSALGMTYHVNSNADYTSACERCEVWVYMTEALRAAIVPVLAYDRRHSGSHGRALNAVTDALRAVGLRPGDRLEPTDELPDVGRFEVLPLPARVLFWRPSRASLCLHRCPLLSDAIGVTMEDTISLDLLHTLYLGPMMTFCKAAIMRLVTAGIWGEFEGAAAERVSASVFALRGELKAWYSDRARTHPDEVLTRLADLTPKMIGDPTHPRMKIKAMECYGLLLFALDMLRKHAAAVGGVGPALVECGDTMVRYIALVKGAEVRMSMALVQD